jgi:Vitamin K-dependent gamma-carboxylase
MNNGTVVGLSPWLPGPLARSRWWTEPVRAERLAALRIAVALVLLLDVFCFYWPHRSDLFGRDSFSALAEPAARGPLLEWHRSWLDGVDSAESWQFLLLAWAGAAGLLLVGIVPRLAAAIAWCFSVSIIHLNGGPHNSGDQVRSILLLYLILTPCGAVWSIQAWRTREWRTGLVFVYPWALRLLFVQLAVIYFMNGIFKLRGDHWHSGLALTYVLGNVAWTRAAFETLAMPSWLLQTMTWTVLLWELGFPVFMMIPWLRKPALWMGVLFHLGTGLTMRLGPFPLYMLCLYVPLLAWEGRERCSGISA